MHFIMCCFQRGHSYINNELWLVVTDRFVVFVRLLRLDLERSVETVLPDFSNISLCFQPSKHSFDPPKENTRPQGLGCPSIAPCNSLVVIMKFTFNRKKHPYRMLQVCCIVLCYLWMLQNTAPKDVQISISMQHALYFGLKIDVQHASYFRSKLHARSLALTHT